MAKVYRMKDKRNIQIGDITISVSPLTSFDKAELAEEANKAAINNSPKDLLNITYTVLKKCLKDVKGVEYDDDESFRIEFDESGMVSQDSIDELMTLEFNNEMIAVCMSLMNNYGTSEFVDPNTGKKLENVNVESENKKGK